MIDELCKNSKTTREVLVFILLRNGFINIDETPTDKGERLMKTLRLKDID